VVSPASGESNSSNVDTAALQRKTTEARKLIGSRWWESFSRIVEPVVRGERPAARIAEAVKVRVEQEEHSNEEGVRIA
jgi:hypothetical protein